MRHQPATHQTFFPFFSIRGLNKMILEIGMCIAVVAGLTIAHYIIIPSVKEVWPTPTSTPTPPNIQTNQRRELGKELQRIMQKEN
jgi:hypothetical protein